MKAKFTYKLESPSGYEAEGESEITPEQYGAICKVIEGAATPQAEPTSLDPQPPGWVQCPECLAGFPLADAIRHAENDLSAEPTSPVGAAFVIAKGRAASERLVECMAHAARPREIINLMDVQILIAAFDAALSAQPASPAPQDEMGKVG